MNNFPAMTEERRQELVADCKISISNLKEALRCAEINGWEQTAAESMSRLLRQEIALAALTAEPDHYVFHHPAGKLLNHLASDECKGQEHVVAGYTAPPAPVLRLPGEVSCEGLDPQEADEARNLGQCEGWNACLAEVKRLNSQPAPTEASNEQ